VGKRSIAFVVIPVVLLCGPLVLVGAILAILGVGNLLNGGHYIAQGPSLILVGMSLATFLGAFFLGRFLARLKP
jgi:hypothetical protein